jgi:predicted NACHT family NTPase
MKKITEFMKKKSKEQDILKQSAEGEEERRIFHSRWGYGHDEGSKEGAKTNSGEQFGSAEKFLEKFLAETRLACLTGPPASGKTVTMQQLVCTHAATSLHNIDQNPKHIPLLPVFMRAAELPKLLAGSTKSVENMRELVAIFINAKVDQGTFDIGVRTQILELFDNDHVLMCIDGLDEAAQHQDLVERIIDGAVKETRSLHILLSTREHSYRHSRGCLRLGAFDVVNLQPLDKDRQRAMIEDRLSKDKVGKFQEQLQAVAGKNP